MMTATTSSKTVLFSTETVIETVEAKRMAYLTLQGEVTQRFNLDMLQSILGRGEGVELRLNDPQVSRRHAKILAVHNRYYIQDLGSTNGTYLNGDRIENERLAHGDLIRVGGSVLRFDVGADIDSDYLKNLNLDTVTSLAEAVDIKDPYTGSHSSAVADVSARLAIAMGMDPDFIERVRIGGRLHDIGKIGVPDAVLRKPGRLDDNEFAQIRRHPVDGESILAPLAFFSDILCIVRHHHERFDGRGYPDGLIGHETPLEARIVQVADSFHAMASRRPYRDVQPMEFVQEQFTRNRGTQFDPEVTDLFLKLLPEIYHDIISMY